MSRGELSRELERTAMALALRALGRAWVLRSFRRPESLRLPEVGPDLGLSPDARRELVGRINRLVLLLFFWRPGRCFYRAYAIACVLRPFGVPVVLNLGYRNLQRPRRGRKRAHCWLTLDGKLFAEPDETGRLFPIALGGIEGQIAYHLGDSEPADRAE